MDDYRFQFTPSDSASHLHSMSPNMIHGPSRRDSYRRRNSLPTAVASSPSNNGLGIPTPEINSRNGPSASELSAAISELSRTGTPSMVQLAALTSPCFFHRRFGDAVNIEKVLDEIKEDDQLSHSRLMQTAASVREVSRQLQRRSTKQAVRNVMIVTKARDNALVDLTRELAEWLLGKPRYGSDVGVNVYVDSKLRRSKRFDADSLTAKDKRFESMLRFWTPALCWASPELFDLVITLGGDGTVLFTSWLFQRIVPPVMSFSLGSLGFLTNFQFNQYKHQLDRIMGDAGMRVTMRMRFTCTVYRAAASNSTLNPPNTSDPSCLATANPTKIEGETHEVLNELVIDRGPSSYISSLDLYANDSLVTRISADGIILSTPTGSTAYSLSAGGSLVHPEIPAILLTPICPHTLSFRPMILNDSMELKVSVPTKGRGGGFVSFDGKGRIQLGLGDEVVVRASKYPFPTVLSQPMEWFDAISRTLRWNTRAAEQKDWAGRDGEGKDDELDEDGVPNGSKEPEFDIDFEDEMDSVRDSGYSGSSSTA
ncbi:ATP-NAD kinase [Aureobasidium subglaciale]|nr:ATP-NAD kinase [Aureobasidium subglaciale]KAI5228596.1 ATP-NAD kinase [Aureobasidium subglaciale]KAI5231979.1 ATP-NAD kinase [Aureobasidium subglaciale]KAI5265705.1 ATP-NAD kinase [Aureobasidium subglaciale]